MHTVLLLVDENYQYLGKNSKNWFKNIKKEINKYYTGNASYDWASIGGHYSNLLKCNPKTGFNRILLTIKPKYKPIGLELLFVNALIKLKQNKKLTKQEAKIHKEWVEKWKKESKLNIAYIEAMRKHNWGSNKKFAFKGKEPDFEFLDRMNLMISYIKGEQPEDKNKELIFRDVWKRCESNKCDVCDIKDLSGPISKKTFEFIEFTHGIKNSLECGKKDYNQYIDKINKKQIKGVLVVLDCHY